MGKFKIPTDLKSVAIEWPVANSGEYVANIRAAEFDTSKKGNPMMVLDLHPAEPIPCMSGDAQVQATPGDKHSLWKFYVTLTAEAAISLKMLEQALEQSWSEGQEIDTLDIIGKRVKVMVSVKTNDKGKKFNQVETLSKI